MEEMGAWMGAGSNFTLRERHAELSSVGFASALSVALGNVYLPTLSSPVEWREALLLSVFLLSSSPTSCSPSSPSSAYLVTGETRSGVVGY